MKYDIATNTERQGKKDMKIFTNNAEVDKYIDEFVTSLAYIPARIYVIMRCGYTEHELNNEDYTVEMLQHEFNYDEFAWDNDWYEGQKYIEIYRILTDDDILSTFVNK